jgi:glucosamine kinase
LTQHLFIGVDGGATKSIIRLEDESGVLLGKEISGPANIRLSAKESWDSIHSALNQISHSLSIDLNNKRYILHAGMGLAGSEMKEAYHSFVNQAHPFTTLVVSSDSHTACLGAHAGDDGAIIIAGTGVVGYQREAGREIKVGGWGFPHDDEGGGAWMGLEAVKLTLKWLDGRAAETHLAKTIYAYFKEDKSQLLRWANLANSTAFAVLAPIVIQQSQQGDVDAIAILKQAARAIDSISDALHARQCDQERVLPCALVGGVTTFLEPYLQASLRSRLTHCQATPDVGAIMLVRDFLKQNG